MTKLVSVYFSGTNNTKFMVERIINNLHTYYGQETFHSINYNLLKSRINDEKIFSADDILVVGAPVYYGRIPDIMNESLHYLRGNNTKAIAIVTYGNRHYDDALLELVNILESNGFKVIGAVATIGKHSIFPSVGKDRPNLEDLNKIDSFINTCIDKINLNIYHKLSIPGNEEYRPIGSVLFKPSGDSRCINCSVCSSICPTKAINKNTPKNTDKSKCISCGACITNCPTKSRNYRGIKYSIGKNGFEEKNSIPKDIEIFV